MTMPKRVMMTISGTANPSAHLVVTTGGGASTEQVRLAAMTTTTEKGGTAAPATAPTISCPSAGI
jgi:hypothetical protein